jgi:alpha 1,3-glucosidase
MNEPSVFEQTDVTLPRMTTFNYNGNHYEHRDAHNAYGYLMHRTTHEALKKKYQKRPFVLTRSFYIGSHKFGAVWTGDVKSRFEDLELSIPMLLSNSIAGFSFVGADVGGFFGDVDHYLFTRWFQLGVFYPFFRGHSHEETYRREPWLYDAVTRDSVKNSIILRYKLLPYLYFTFFQYHKSGIPMLRPIWFKYHNKFTLDLYMNKQFFYGDALLIRPVLTENEHFTNSIATYLPEDDRWFDFTTYQEYTDKGEVNIKITNDNIGVFIKGGSILPMRFRMRRSTKLMRFEPLTLIVALNSEESASGMIYFDDEESFDYEDTSKYYLKKLMFQKDELFIANLHDEFKITNRIERILLLGLKKKVKNVYYESFLDGKKSDLEFEVKESNLLEIKRLQISMDNLWKIKLEFSDE